MVGGETLNNKIRRERDTFLFFKTIPPHSFCSRARGDRQTTTRETERVRERGIKSVCFIFFFFSSGARLLRSGGREKRESYTHIFFFFLRVVCSRERDNDFEEEEEEEEERERERETTRV